MKKLFFFMILVYVLTACQQDKKLDIEAYYLPVNELWDGLVYEYKALNNDSLPPYYWYFRTVEHRGINFLTGMYYDHAFTPQQFIREEKISNGMLLAEMFLYETDTLDKQRQVPVEIMSGNTFPFQVQDSLGVFLYKIRWKLPSDSSTITIIRNRRYMGEIIHEYEGKTYKCVEFRVRELIDNEQEGFLELELSGIERYAKGIGLIYTERTLIGGGFEQKYQLVDRYPMTKLEQKFKEKSFSF